MNRDKSLILIADDNNINLKILGHIAQAKGYEIVFAQTGKEALAYAKIHEPDLILLDVIMPDIDGFEVCRRLKNIEEIKDIPVIFITAKTESQDIAQGFEAGAVDYITKPFYTNEVSARIATHLKLKNSQDDIIKFNSQLQEMLNQRTKELLVSERQAAFGQLIQGIVHNLRNPVAKIFGSIELAKKNYKKLEYLKTKETRKFFSDLEQELDWINYGASELHNMIENMMAKSIRDKSENIEIFNLNELLTDELSFLEADLHFKHKIKKELQLSSEPILLKAIRSEISQVFNNLVRNAIDSLHFTKKGVIKICSKIDNKTAVMVIEDNGNGISNDVIDKIFDPFFTTKPTRRIAGDSQPLGTGLGLHFCYSTIKTYKGTITVDSELNKGTRFVVTIPLFDAIN